MKTFKLIPLLASLAVLTVLTCRAQQPTPLLTKPADELIAVLKSDAAQKDKADACRLLAVVGTKAAVPALVALLPDDKLNHMARFALETIPDPSVDQAFREALATLKGRPLVGVIGSVGVRKDPKAVPALARLLQLSDAEVAQASARALGKIGTAAAVTALEGALPTAPAAHQLALCEGLLRCAETLQASGEAKAAGAIYDQLRRLRVPPHVRVAALRGAVLNRGAKGGPLLNEALQSQDYILFAAAVQTSYQVPGPDVTRILAATLPRLSEADRKLLVIQALGKRTESAGIRALSMAAKSGAPPVRIAAIHALAETGQADAAAVLVDLLTANEKEVSQAATESLAGITGKDVDRAIQSLLRSQSIDQRLAGIELIGRRRMSTSVPDLLKASTDSDVRIRPAALQKVGELGTPADVIPVLDALPKLNTTAELEAAEQALSILCSRADRPEASTEKLTTRLGQAQPGQKSVLLRVLSSVGGPGALEAVRQAVQDPNAEVHAAAIRALGAWKTADAAPDLLALAKGASNPTEQTLCLRSYLGLAANSDVPADQRLTMCRAAVDLAKENESKRLLLAALGNIDSPESVAVIAPYLDDPGTKDEASAAIVGIAEKLLKGQRSGPSSSKVIPALEKVIQTTGNDDLSKRAKASLDQARKRVK